MVYLIYFSTNLHIDVFSFAVLMSLSLSTHLCLLYLHLNILIVMMHLNILLKPTEVTDLKARSLEYMWPLLMVHTLVLSYR